MNSMQNTENTTNNPGEKTPSDEQLRQTVERVLGRADASAQTTIYPESTGSPAQRRVLDTRAREISDNQREHSDFDGEQEDLAERRALRRVAGLSTELDDVTEVEYRQLRLERRGSRRGCGLKEPSKMPRTPCENSPRSPKPQDLKCWTG